MTVPSSTFITKGPVQIADGGAPADCNVAVSSTHVVVTGRNAFACLTKDGTPVAPAPNLQARRYLVEEFFPALGVPVKAIPPTPPGQNNYGSPGKDGRVVFDQHRKRFFMVFQGRQLPPVLYIAASKSEDPSDGWFVYGDNVLLSEGLVNGQDYQWTGINGESLLVCNSMAQMAGTAPFLVPPDWTVQQTIPVCLTYDLDALASGNKNYDRGFFRPNTTSWVVPCVHDSFTTDSYWISRDDPTHVTVWGGRGGAIASQQVTIQPSPPAVGGPLPGPPGKYVVDYNKIIFNAPTNAQYRDGKLVAVFNDGVIWPGQTQPNNAVRLVRLDVSMLFEANEATLEIDRIFGQSATGDPVGEIFDYGWPAVSTSARGDIVIGSIRSNAQTFTQFRASVWFAGDADISSSMHLSSSIVPLTEFHMAGAGYDRSTGAVFVAQQVTESDDGPYQIRVASILGGQPKWRMCASCLGLFYLGRETPTQCPATSNHVHEFASSQDFSLHTAGTGPSGQENWRWCKKCQCLSFAGDGPPRKCAMGGTHDLSASENYELVQNAASLPPSTVNLWRWCNKCMILYFGALPNLTTVCLEGGSHDETESGNYALEVIPDAP